VTLDEDIGMQDASNCVNPTPSPEGRKKSGLLKKKKRLYKGENGEKKKG